MNTQQQNNGTDVTPNNNEPNTPPTEPNNGTQNNGGEDNGADNGNGKGTPSHRKSRRSQETSSSPIGESPCKAMERGYKAARSRQKTTMDR